MKKQLILLLSLLSSHFAMQGSVWGTTAKLATNIKNNNYKISNIKIYVRKNETTPQRHIG